MLNEPPNENEDKKRRQRRPHPLERRDASPPGQQQSQPPQQGRVMLRMPVVRPVAVWALIGINAVIYVLVQFILSDADAIDLYRSLWNNHRAVLENGEYHRLVSAMFLHSLETPFHIVFNMYALYAIGITVERFFGHLRFLAVYFLGGLAGSILSILLNGPDVVSVGASGAVFAIFGAEMVFLYKHRTLFGDMAKVQLRQLAIIAGINLLFGLASTFTQDGTQIDNWAHIGGFLGGTFIAWVAGPVFIPQRHPTQPDALTIQDINPLEKNSQTLLAYVSALLIVLIAGSLLARGGF